MKKIFMDALVLFCVTLVAGVALATVYAVTKEPIAEAELAARAEAYRMVFADAADFAADTTVDAAVTTSAETFTAAGFEGVSVTNALYALDADGNRIGAVMTMNGVGYAANITFTLGITSDGKISGISVLSHSETPGLGAKCTDETFSGQFAGKPAAALTVVKGGAGENEIDAISGATVTSRGITTAVNAGIWFADDVMQIGGGAS